MAATPFACALDARASLGECPVWSVAEQALFWVDINAPSLNRFDPASGRNVAMPMPQAIGCFALRESGGFVVALRDGLWFAGSDGALERKIAGAPYEMATHRFNDGRCDPAGRFFAGTMNEKRDADSAGLYCLDADLRMTRVLSDMMISNGLAWSPDGRTMYHADTPTHTIRAFDFDGPADGRRTRASSRSGAAKPTGPTAAPWTVPATTGPRSTAEERSSSCRPPARFSPNTPSRPCARRCARSAGRT